MSLDGTTTAPVPVTAVTGPEAGPGDWPGRVRFRFSKVGKIRFTSQRDTARMWERALRRSRLPVAWSEGFSPRPLLSFGLALPTGCESLAEYLDVRLQADLAAPGTPEEPSAGRWAGTGPGSAWDELVRLMDPLLPDGVAVEAAGPVGVGAGSLQQEVTSCSWELEVLGLTNQELAERVERLLASPSIVVRRERKGRQVEDDLRPSVLTLVPEPGPLEHPTAGAPRCRLRAELATQPRGVRPAELLEGLGAGVSLARACRTHQWIERDGVRSEPLPVGTRSPEPIAPPVPGTELAT